jgi:MHS family proline/betaine transporter-like MFS transporter
VLLVAMRFLQGIAAGGEMGGATAFVAESAPAARRATYTSLVNSSASVGALAAALSALAVNSIFTQEQVLEFAWRIPFLLSLPLAIVGLWIRTRLEDTPQFEQLQQAHEVEKVPVVELVKHHKAAIIRMAALSGLLSGGYYIAFTYAPIHLQRSGGLSASFAFLATSVALIVCACIIPLAGALSDRVGRRPVFLLAGGLGVLAAVPAFMLMGSGSELLALAGQLMLGLPVSLSIGPAFAAFAEGLPANVRSSGMSMALNIAMVVAGGTAPFIAAWLVATTGEALSPAGFYGVCALCVLIGAITVKETAGKSLPLE